MIWIRPPNKERSLKKRREGSRNFSLRIDSRAEEGLNARAVTLRWSVAANPRVLEGTDTVNWKPDARVGTWPPAGSRTFGFVPTLIPSRFTFKRSDEATTVPNGNDVSLHVVLTNGDDKGEQAVTMVRKGNAWRVNI